MRSIALQNDELRVVCFPGHGMLVTEIVPRGRGVNLLWQRADGPLHDFVRQANATPEGDPFDDLVFAGGWFGMFPNAGIPGVRDADEQMHGVFPRSAWDVVYADDVTVSCTLESAGFAAMRTLRLEGSSARIETKVTNTRPIAREVSFGEHPCFARDVFGGGTVALRAVSACTMEDVSEPGANRFRAGQQFLWPLAADSRNDTTRTDVIPAMADGTHDHLCVRLSQPLVELSAPRLDGRVYVRSGLRETPHLLFWRHFLPPRSPWRGDVFGIEMMSTPGRTRDDAREHNALRVLGPGETVAWFLEIQWNSDHSTEYG